MLGYSEARLTEAFKYPSKLIDADIEELTSRMASEASKANAKLRKQQRVGEANLGELPKRKAKSAIQSIPKTSIADLERLKSAWSAK